MWTKERSTRASTVPGRSTCPVGPSGVWSRSSRSLVLAIGATGWMACAVGANGALSDQSNSEGVTLEAAFSRSADRMRVHYTVRNEGAQPIGVFRHLPSPDSAGPGLSPDHVFRDLEDGTLRLRKLAPELPEGVEMAERPLPFVSRLEPGESLEEEFSVSVPVRVNDPVRRARMGARPGRRLVADRPAMARRIVLSIGVFDIDSSLRLIPLTPEYPGVYRVWPPGPAVDRQRILSVGTDLDADLPVLDLRFVTR